MEMVGNKDDIKKLKGPDLGSGPVISIIEKTEALLKSMPAVYDEIRNSGNYELALRKFVEALLENGNSQMFNDMVKLVAGVLEIIAQQKYYVPRQDQLFPQADRKLKILKIIDLCLFAGDLIRIGGNIQSSRQLESWEVIARASQVKLNPTESTTIPYVQVRLTATVVNFGTDPDVHPFFEWKTWKIRQIDRYQRTYRPVCFRVGRRGSILYEQGQQFGIERGRQYRLHLYNCL